MRSTKKIDLVTAAVVLGLVLCHQVRADVPEGWPSVLTTMTVTGVPGESSVEMEWYDSSGGYYSTDPALLVPGQSYWVLNGADSFDFGAMTAMSLTYYAPASTTASWIIPLTAPGLLDFDAVAFDYDSTGLGLVSASFQVPEPATAAMLAPACLLLSRRSSKTRAKRLES